ncbi:uncharacterized protein LOC130903623 [Diorhabda carinulata]|uniref:uncharacterized protein LOC130903623 n=1 Tax=Diorhabda carinulata TaxID=1163345 RepID=UPI0025A17B4D|nr:uncharacterized protein LOC130903623 [Diorhabda carinulata]
MQNDKKCTCCTCEVRSTAMLSVKTTTSYNTATGDDCSCSSYSCSEISSEKTAESVINCNCSKCVCSVCPAKPAKRFIQTTSQVGDTATNKLTNSICNCERCFCAVCPSRKSDSMAKSSQTNKPTADQGTGEGNKCDCSVSKIQSTVKVSTQQIRNKEETQTNICNCNECPNMSSILLKAPITCKCIECKCDPCIDPKVNEEIEIANITDSSDDCQCPDLSQPVVAFKPPTECFCIKCDCDPCIDTKVRTNTEEGDCQCPDLTNPIGDFFKSPTTCFCSPCKCNPCSDPNKTKDGGSSAYNNKCTCDTKGQSCECKFCSDPTKLKEDVLRKPPACICNKCTCNSCADENKKDQIEEQKKNGPVCDNDNCDCSPCIDPNKVKQNIGFEVKQRISCDCLKCICNFCSISDKGKGDQVDPNAQLTVQGNCNYFIN